MPATLCHRRGYGVGSIYAYRFSDTEKPIFVGRDKYRLSDTMSRHVPPVSMDDAPEARSARLDRLDPGERAEERRRDHGRDRDDDAGVVAPVTGIRVSATRTDDPRRPAPEAGRWPVRTFSEGKGGGQIPLPWPCTLGLSTSVP